MSYLRNHRSDRPGSTGRMRDAQNPEAQTYGRQGLANLHRRGLYNGPMSGPDLAALYRAASAQAYGPGGTANTVPAGFNTDLLPQPMQQPIDWQQLLQAIQGGGVYY